MNSSHLPGRLVLASSSPRRQELVASLGLDLPVRVLSSDADESVEPGLSPQEIVEELSLRKARATAELLAGEQPGTTVADDLVLGADTIVVLGDRVLGKPVDADDAVRTLMALSGRTHEVYTGIALLRHPAGTIITGHRRTLVTMKAFDEEAARRYAATGEPLDKAGSYGIQGRGAVLVDRIDGCYFNVMGLSLSLLADMLAETGIRIF